METILVYGVGLLALVGAVILLAAAYYVVGRITWWANFYWRKAININTAVQLGWNTGTPPENEWVFVRENMDHHRGKNFPLTYDTEYGWALMKNIDGRMYSASGGLSMPVENIDGWMRTIEGAPGKAMVERFCLEMHPNWSAKSFEEQESCREAARKILQYVLQQEAL